MASTLRLSGAAHPREQPARGTAELGGLRYVAHQPILDREALLLEVAQAEMVGHAARGFAPDFAVEVAVGSDQTLDQRIHHVLQIEVAFEIEGVGGGGDRYVRTAPSTLDAVRHHGGL